MNVYPGLRNVCVQRPRCVQEIFCVSLLAKTMHVFAKKAAGPSAERGAGRASALAMIFPFVLAPLSCIYGSPLNVEVLETRAESELRPARSLRMERKVRRVKSDGEEGEQKERCGEREREQK